MTTRYIVRVQQVVVSAAPCARAHKAVSMRRRATERRDAGLMARANEVEFGWSARARRKHCPPMPGPPPSGAAMGRCAHTSNAARLTSKTVVSLVPPLANSATQLPMIARGTSPWRRSLRGFDGFLSPALGPAAPVLRADRIHQPERETSSQRQRLDQIPQRLVQQVEIPLENNIYNLSICKKKRKSERVRSYASTPQTFQFSSESVAATVVEAEVSWSKQVK